MEENLLTIIKHADVSSIADLSLDRSKSETYSQVDGLSLQNLYYTTNGFFPNARLFRDTGRSGDNYLDTESIFDAIVERLPKDVNIESIRYSSYDMATDEEEMGFSILIKEWNIWARVEKALSETYVLYPNNGKEHRDWLLKILKEFYIAPEEEKNNVFTLSQDQSGFHLIKSKVKVVEDFDVDKQYNDDFKEIDEIAQDFIEEEGKSGLLILHGEKGTGKTTYIRHLINEYPGIKFVTIPPSLLGLLGEPAFMSFMMSQLGDSVIILEDCETAIADRKVLHSGNNVALLLNLADGLMSDDLAIKFICTFNEEIASIDSALMRKGRLVAEYDFKNLCPEKTKSLLKEVIEDKKNTIRERLTELEATQPSDEEKKKRLQKKLAVLESLPEYSGKKGMSLADIYNVDETSFVEEKKTIGF